MAATTKLIVWNETLRELGDHPLADTSTANTRQQALNNAWDHAIEYTLSRRDWNFARRRATLTGVASGAHPPYTFAFSRPSDYLRKVWVKTAADDEFQIPHAEVGAAVYALQASALIEYISDHADNYDPANWPPQFTRVMVLYMAMLIAPKIGRTGQTDAKEWYQKLEVALSEADRVESVTTINATIATERAPILRRALEHLGQQIGGSVPAMSDTDALRWQINKGWDTAVRFLLEQAPWNFALRRVTLTGTGDNTSYPPYTYRYDRPASYAKRVWIKEDPADTFEADYAEAGTSIYGYVGVKIMEYIAQDAAALTVANWPASFGECLSLYLAAQIAPLGRETIGEDGKRQRTASARDALMTQFSAQLEMARATEAVRHETKNIEPERLPVMRRAMEIMGQSLSGYIITEAHTAALRWQMNLGWDHAVKTVLSEGAWNFATKRALFQSGATGDTYVPTTSVEGITDGYSVEPGPSVAETDVDISGYDYSYPVPDDFLHKIWLKSSVSSDSECPHQFMGNYVLLNYDPAIMEYVALDDTTSDPDNWPVLFLDAVAAFLAWQVAPELTVQMGSGKGARVSATGLPQKLEAAYQRKLSDAKNKDAIQQYPFEMAPGRFARARRGGYSFGRVFN